MIALGVLRPSWCRERAYLTLPPNNPYVQSLAGRRKGVLVTLVFDASKCNDEEAMDKYHNILTQFVGTITVIRRSDGAYYCRVALPLKISGMLLPIKDCVRAHVFLEPWQISRGIASTARSLSKM
jgi:hypothetical protein